MKLTPEGLVDFKARHMEKLIDFEKKLFEKLKTEGFTGDYPEFFTEFVNKFPLEERGVAYTFIFFRGLYVGQASNMEGMICEQVNIFNKKLDDTN